MRDVAASRFLRPFSHTTRLLDPFRLARIKQAMDVAAQGGIFHLWWHPHNFGVNVTENMTFLNEILKHFSRLRDETGMTSSCMGDFA